MEAEASNMSRLSWSYLNCLLHVLYIRRYIYVFLEPFQQPADFVAHFCTVDRLLDEDDDEQMRRMITKHKQKFVQLLVKGDEMKEEAKSDDDDE